jgi:hypothetical protein
VQITQCAGIYGHLANLATPGPDDLSINRSLGISEKGGASMAALAKENVAIKLP